MISISKLNHQFNNKVIFDSFSLEIIKGEKVVLKGDSGTGKTTLLNIIMGFLIPNSGEIKVSDMKLNRSNIRAIRKLISWLPQDLSVIGRGNTKDIILFPFERFEENKKNAPKDSLIEKYFEELHLDKSILQSDYQDISGGEKQRVGIIICKLLKSPIMLLDEPTSALDRTSRKNVSEFILNDSELTVLSCSHDDDWVNACKRIVYLEEHSNV